MGRKRQRADGSASMRRLSLALAAVAWAAAATAEVAVPVVGNADVSRIHLRGDAVQFVEPIRPRWRRVLAHYGAGTVHADGGVVTHNEERDGSGSAEPTPAPTSAAPTPTSEAPTPTSAAPAPTSAAPAPTSAAPTPSSAPPTPTPTSKKPPPSSSSSRGDELPAPSSEAPVPSTTAPAPAPAPSTPPPAPSTSDENVTPPPSVEPTSQPPSPAASSEAPPPTTAPPGTNAPPAPSTEPPAPTPGPPAPTPGPPAPTPGPPTPTPGPPAATPGPPAPTPGPPAPTNAPPAPTTGAPAPTTGAPVPSTAPLTTPAPPASTTKAPAATTAAPTSKTPTVAPTPTPTPTTQKPELTTKAPAHSGASSGHSDTTASDSKTGDVGKVSAPDLSTLAPIAGSGIISKSTREPSNSSSDGASASSKNTAAQTGLNKISTLGIAGIVVGLMAVVVVAILFVHVRRKRTEKAHDTTRQRELDDFFAHDAAPPIPHSGHPGAASLVSSNGMSFVPPSRSLTPPSEIPVASSGRFNRQSSKPMTPNTHHRPGRFNDNVMNQGGIVPKGRMYSIPASPHGNSSDFDQSGDSFLGANDDSSAGNFSIRTSSDNISTGLRDTSFSRGSSEARSTYFPLSESRSTAVQMGVTGGALPRSDSGNILVPRPVRGESMEYSVSSGEDYGSPDHRADRTDSNVSSASNANPWALVTLDDSLIKSISPPTSFDDAGSREVSEISMLSDLPSSRSDGSFYMSDDGGRSTRGTSDARSNSIAYSADGYFDDSARSGRSTSFGYASEDFQGSSQRSDRTDSYGYANSSFAEGSTRSALSFTSSESERRSSSFRPSESGGPDILEGHI